MKLALTLACSAALAFSSQRAEACGCFTPPDPTVPVVQAGERILFAVKDGQVTAHVQVQYSGAAGDFGWLLPLPAVPTLELGSDELFAQLTRATQPQYQMSTVYDSSCPVGFPGGFASGGGSGSGGGPGFADAGSAGPSPLVVQDSVGPYDYAVLKADSKDAMLQWLSSNRYFVPAGTDDAVGPYIQPGAFFLALKLRPGNGTGDLQPVVLRYQSEVGVIPITLTATGAQKNMGVQVWMLGAGRAIPRNYRHTIINDAVIDWRNRGSNYNDVIIRAVGEAPEKHSFVTEYAGPSEVVLLAPPGRFGTQLELADQPDAQSFLRHLLANGFLAPTTLNPFAGPLLPATLKAILAKWLPPPPGVSLDSFYFSYDFYLPSAPPQDYRPQEMAEEIFTRVVAPMRAAAALFATHPVLTRLYTTLSPADMNKDPAFSFNPSLPAVSNVHRATLTVSCTGYAATSAQLLTEQGATVFYPGGPFGPPQVDPASVPATASLEVLREEGPPLIERTLFNPALPQSPRGCSCGAEPGVALAAAALLWVRGARRREALRRRA